MTVVRLTPDLAITPDGAPNLTRRDFDAQLQAEQNSAFEGARERARQAAAVRRFDEGGGDLHEAMSQLALSFPVPRAAHASGALQGVRPWDAIRFWVSADGCLDDTGARQAGAFVLHVWNEHGWWSLTGDEREEARVEAKRYRELFAGPLRFEHGAALASWDRGQLDAYVGWAERPWWG